MKIWAAFFTITSALSAHAADLPKPGHLVQLQCRVYSMETENDQVVLGSQKLLAEKSTAEFDPYFLGPKLVIKLPRPYESYWVSAEVTDAGYMEEGDSVYHEQIFRVWSPGTASDVIFSAGESPAGNSMTIRNFETYNSSTWLAHHCTLKFVR